MTPIVHVISGPDRHGVVRFGVELHDRLHRNGFDIDRAGSLVTWRSGQGAHLQFTDRLFGTDAGQAAAAVGEFAAAVRSGGGRVTATLHDLPQPSDGRHQGDRARAYASLIAQLDGVVVSSDHERLLLRDIGIQHEPAVIPLPVPSSQPPVDPPESWPLTVAVFGFVYPGKGHAEVLDAMAGLPAGVRVMAIGEASPGHDDLIEDLVCRARTQNRPFVTTGHVPDDRLTTLLRSVTVPVAHHRHVSASGSLNSWLAAGRRPLVPITRYTCELARRSPGALRLYRDDRDELAAAIRSALDDPQSTWLPPLVVCVPTPDQAARSYARFLGAVHR